MNSMVNFILESGISLAVFAIIYIWLLRKETFFKMNRFFLIGSVLFSVVLPFLRFKVFNTNPVMLSEITVTPYRNLIEAVTVYGKDLSGSIEEVILSANGLVLLYLGGVTFFLIRFLLRVAKIYFLVSKNEIHQKDGFKLVLIQKDYPPFSFLNYIFITQSEQQKDHYNKLIVHELEHVKQGHTFDVLLLEILFVFQWFNPFMWVLRRAITENHEYLADQAVLNSGTKRGYYKKLLLGQYIGMPVHIANHFNYSLVKNRIKMMSKIESSKVAFGKLFFGIIAAATLVVFFACEQQDTFVFNKDTGKQGILNEDENLKGWVDKQNKLTELVVGNTNYIITYDSLGRMVLTRKKVDEQEELLVENEKIYTSVDNMPKFPGGENALGKYISSSVIYPEKAIEQNIQGKVFVSFIITKNGDVANATTARTVHPLLDEEALRVINSLPRWSPGEQEGKPVNVSYTLPINFTLQ